MSFLRIAILFIFGFTILQAQRMHGLSMMGPLKYQKGFSHFDYANPHAPQGGTFRTAVVGTFDTLNPFTIQGTPAAGLSYLYPSHTFATLMHRSHDEIFSSYGYVAESVEIAPDEQSITFYLRKEAVFHDGSPIQAEDIRYTFEQLTQKGLPLFQKYYHDIKAIHVIDSHTIRFEFRHTQNKELKSIIGDMPILSKAFLEQHPLDQVSLIPLLGSGPYKIDQVDVGRRITYSRVPNWWGNRVAGFKGHYNVARIEYIYYRDADVAFQSFKSGGCDWRLETEIARWFKQYDFPAVRKGHVIKENYHHQMTQPMTGLAFNTRRPPFADRRVRQAISYAFDFEWINKNLFHGAYQRLQTYFANSELASTGKPSGAVAKILEHYRDRIPSDIWKEDYKLPINNGSGNIRSLLQHAVKLLNEAGYIIKDFKCIHQKTGKPLEFEILLTSSLHTRILQHFIQNLEILGIKASLRLVDTSQYLKRTTDYDFDMIIHRIGQSHSPGNEQRYMWTSTAADTPGTQNMCGIKDPVVDDLVERIIQAKTYDELKDHCQALDLVLLHNGYMIPFWYSDTLKISYWSYVKHPEQMPPYHLTTDIFWIDLEKQKEIGHNQQQ